MTELIKLRFLGARLKVRRAKHHINDANGVIKRFIALKPYEFVAETNAAGGEDLIIRLTEPLPESLPAIIGDAVHNLASALDHMMWELLVAENGIPDRRLQFPRSRSAEDYKSVRSRMLKFGFQEKTADMLQELGVHPGGKNELVWKLLQTDITDKHSIMLPTVGTALLNAKNREEEIGGHAKFDANGRIRFFSLQEPGAKLQLERDPDITVFVIFDEGMLFANQPIQITLEGLYETVRALIDRFMYCGR
jgi:hypothetical protein